MNLADVEMQGHHARVEQLTTDALRTNISRMGQYLSRIGLHALSGVFM